MQDHAEQEYIFGHLSLIRNLALDIPSGVAAVKDHQNWVPLKKERSLECFLGHLSFQVSGVKSPLIYLFFNKKKKKGKKKYMTE